MGGFVGDLFGGDSDRKMPAVAVGNPKQTAQPTEQLSEQSRKNRMLAASILTQNWEAPKLSQKGLLGL